MKKKKIVFVMNNFWIGGAERLLLDLVAVLCLTYQVEIVTVLGPGPLKPEFDRLSVGVSHMSPMIFANKKLPFKLFWILAAPITLLRLVIFLFKVKPDVVITSLYQSDILGIMGAYFCGVKKRIVIQHDVQTFGFLRKYFKIFCALRLTTNVVAISGAVEDFLVSYFKVPKQKIVFIQNGIDIEKFKNAIKPLNEKEIVFGIISRLEPVKGHIYLLKALKILKDSYKLEPKVMIAGDGSLRKYLAEYVKVNLLKKVEFLGSVADVSQFLKSIDISVVPSIEEGFGLVVLEGLASRKTVLVSDIKAFQELIQSGKNGVLFKMGNAEDLAHELKKLIDQPSLVASYIKNIDLWMSQTGFKYDIRYIASEYRKIIG